MDKTLTLPDARPKPGPARVSVPPTLTKNTARVLWIGKTTVCRIFSCQRSAEGLRPLRLPCSLTRGGPFTPLRSRGAHRRRALGSRSSVNPQTHSRGFPLEGLGPAKTFADRQPSGASRDALNIVPALAGWLPADARSPGCSFTPDLAGAKAGGEYRARTGDLLVANQALSQLS